MEKADILEMAVEHLQFLRAAQVAPRPPNPYELAQKYSAGFRECVSEVTRCLGSIPDVTPDVKHRLMRHLNTYVDTMNACNGLLASQQSALANQNRGFILPTNQRQDYNANMAPFAQLSPPLAQGNKNHVIRVPKPIKPEPLAYDASMLRTPYLGPTSYVLGEYKAIEQALVRSGHVESPEEGAAVPSTSSSAQSSAETERSRTSLLSEESDAATVSRKLDFNESADGEKVGVDTDKVGVQEEEVKQGAKTREEAVNDANNNKANNARHHSDDEDEDMWRPW
jgi:hypothetical protein